MSITKVPNCKISYPKDLSKLILEFNPLDFPLIYTSALNSSQNQMDFNKFEIGISITPKTSLSLPTVIYPTIDIWGDIYKKLTVNVQGILSFSIANNTLTGVDSLFTSQLEKNDIVVLVSSTEKYVLTIDSVINNTTCLFNANIDNNTLSLTGDTAYRIRPKVEILASNIVSGATEIPDGLYALTVTATFADTVNIISNTFYQYVYANQYKCVGENILKLISDCNNCTDTTLITHTLILKALLDALEIALRDNDYLLGDALNSTSISINAIIDKIDRYCLLMNNNCTSC